MLVSLQNKLSGNVESGVGGHVGECWGAEPGRSGAAAVGTGRVIALCVESRWALISERGGEETGPVRRSGGLCRGGRPERTTQSTCTGPECERRESLGGICPLPEHPNSSAWPEGESWL